MNRNVNLRAETVTTATLSGSAQANALEHSTARGAENARVGGSRTRAHIRGPALAALRRTLLGSVQPGAWRGQRLPRRHLRRDPRDAGSSAHRAASVVAPRSYGQKRLTRH